jgi:mRNA interferase RelE/StbE
MADYVIIFARAARKDLESLEASVVKRVFPKIENLAAQPRPNGCRKLIGEENLWRIRVGDYRVIYSIDDIAGKVDVICQASKQGIRKLMNRCIERVVVGVGLVHISQ